MKPLHGEVTRLSRCPCCVSKYSRVKPTKHNNSGKTRARQEANKAIKKELP